MIEFVGPSYQLNTRKADVQRTVNMYVVKNEVAGGKSAMYLESIPGLTVFSEHAPLGWNTGNEAGVWTFTNDDFTAEATP